MVLRGPVLQSAIKLRLRVPFTLRRIMANQASSTMPCHPPRPRRFAPLNPAYPNTHSAPALKGIIFDVDGTLCLPQNHMFGEMRAALDITRSVDILDHIRSLSDEPDSYSTPSPRTSTPDGLLSSTTSPPATNSTNTPPTIHTSSPRSRAITTIQSIERSAMTHQTPQPGLKELMTYLTSRNIPKALCTRNFPAPVHHLLDKYLEGEVFEPIITRETMGVRPKPSPEGIWVVAKRWGLGVGKDIEGSVSVAVSASTSIWPSTDATGISVSEEEIDLLVLARKSLGAGLIMVGDSIDDMAAGYRAGAATVLLVNEENGHLMGHEYTDLVVERLDELVEVLEGGFVGKGNEKVEGGGRGSMG